MTKDDAPEPAATGRRRPRGSYSKGRAKRAEILSEAVRVFAESGYRGGSLKEIADRVGLSQAGLLHHFTSKEQLLAEVLAARDAEDAERLFPADVQLTGDTVLEHMAGQVRHNTTVPGLVQLYATLSGEAVTEGHPAREPFVERYRVLRELLTRAIADAQETSQIDPSLDPQIAATALVAVMDGLQTQWLLEPDVVDMPAVFDAFLALLRGHNTSG